MQHSEASQKSGSVSDTRAGRAQSGGPSSAGADAERGVELDPSNPVSYDCRAAVHMLAGDYKLALTDFNHVLEMAPQQEDGLREPRQSALRHKPDDFDLLGFRGHARQHTGDLQGSLADLDKALGIRQDNARAHALRGETREKLGDLKSAFADLTQALKIQPSFPEASAAMVRVQHALGQ